MGYHTTKIKKGELGEFSKIQEEFEELTDAISQNNPLLELCECADLIGAIEAYIIKYNITLIDLIKMMNCTKEAFIEGSR